MPNGNHIYGFTYEAWAEAKREAMDILRKRAKKAQPITYSQFVNQISAVRMSPEDYALLHFMEELSTEEHEAGRPLISALIVQQASGQPGKGFFELARKLGYTVTDETAFWIDQINQLQKCWS